MSLTSPSLMANSGCHCTPMQKRRPGASMPSMTPSGATALMTTPAGSSAAAWWWELLTARLSVPTISRSRLPALIATVWPGWLRGFGCSWASGPLMASGMCWISVPPRATCRSCWPPQMPRIGMSASSAPRVIASSKAVRRSLVRTVGWRPVPPKRTGSTSKLPPVMTSPSMAER
jgi:hypothetical protein